MQHQPAEAGQNEHVLDHDRARDQIGELQAHDGQDRDVSAFGRAWRQSAARRDTPLARAVRMKSSFSASRSAERVTRVRIAACTTPSATAGRISAPSARSG